ncbi:hypothetical protein WDW86_02070 [Bdellovibrionota bacterium FG-2]
MSADIETTLLRLISILRREQLALIESVYGQTPQWEFVRSQMLRLLGERGFEGELKLALRENQDGRRNQDPA